MKFNLKNIIYNRLIFTEFFWRYRHFYHKNVWVSYLKDSFSERRYFYSNLISKKKFVTVFEFGCASGPNLLNIKKNVPYQTYFFGYDISNKAIEFAQKKIHGENAFFTNKLSHQSMLEKLSFWGFDKFDLAIYDRVLCYLSEKQIHEHFKNYIKYFNSIIIDDFHNEQCVDNNGAYSSKDFVKILNYYNFQLNKIDNSEHQTQSSTSEQDTFFYKRNAKRLIFSKIS